MTGRAMRNSKYTDPERQAAELVEAMSVDEKVSLLTGADFWHSRGVECLGIKPFRMTDGPHGVTVSRDVVGAATCFPTGIGLGATWSASLLQEVGAALGRETRARSSEILLGPCVDLQRSPLNGRGYESYSEDPYLAGKLAAAYITGAATEGIGCSVKHYTCNNQQTEQHSTSAQVDERSLRELYLPAFRMAVDAGAISVMNAYNLVNGSHCSENRHLLTEILKNEWRFKGFIVSDWRSVHTTGAVINGLDLEMPGPGKVLTRENLLPMIDSGELLIERIDDAARRIVRAALLVESNRYVNGALRSGEIDTDRHRNLAFRAACESITLLKNDRDVLPIDERAARSIAVIGPNAAEARLGGGGSSSVTPFYSVSPLEGLRSRCGESIRVEFSEGCSFVGGLPVLDGSNLRASVDRAVHGMSAAYFANTELEGAPCLERIDAQIDFSWGWASPGGAVPKDGYSARWDGFFVPPETGRYEIGVTASDGGFRLFTDDALVIDRWIDSDAATFEDRFTVHGETIEIDCEEDRPVSLRLEYAKTGNKATVRLEWKKPGDEGGIDSAVRVAAECDYAIVFAGISNRFEGGNNDRTDITLPGDQDRLIRAVAQANPKTAVVLVNGSPVDVSSFVNEVPAIIEAWYPGQEGGNAIAAILFGDENPSGKLPQTIPLRLEDNPSHGNFPGENGVVEYDEGIFVGYRHYDANAITPAFPFGFGLSYTRFGFSRLRCATVALPTAENGAPEASPTPRDGIADALLPARNGTANMVEVSVAVKNIGSRRGSEVVQLYVHDEKSSIPRPPKELKAFEKISLGPGEERVVRFELCADTFAYFDPAVGDFVTEPGVFKILVGGNPDSLLETVVEFDGTRFYAV